MYNIHKIASRTTDIHTRNDRMEALEEARSFARKDKVGLHYKSIEPHVVANNLRETLSRMGQINGVRGRWLL